MRTQLSFVLSQITRLKNRLRHAYLIHFADKMQYHLLSDSSVKVKVKLRAAVCGNSAAFRLLEVLRATVRLARTCK